ncbi:MAG TPA: DUF2306 domain-containing protein [Gemmatimonadaceae bacterium]|nr:DUF2306 domain-containing protein [Gemmatimonadaceae bacterium]
MTSLGYFHFATSLLALISGAFVLFRAKGTRMHRRVGWVYVASMVALNASALSLYRLTGTFGPFHIAALISLMTVAAGVDAARQRKRANPTWLRRHYFFMSYSYLGLVAAAIAETATRWPALQEVAGGPTVAFWTTVVVASVAVFIVGGIVVRRRAEVMMRPFRVR